MSNTVRIYGKILNEWFGEKRQWTQVEYSYKEYTTDGELIAEGSEDFSQARLSLDKTRCNVWTWDGEKLNRGGYHRYDYRGCFEVRTEDMKAFKAYILNKYKAASVRIKRF